MSTLPTLAWIETLGLSDETKEALRAYARAAQVQPGCRTTTAGSHGRIAARAEAERHACERDEHADGRVSTASRELVTECRCWPTTSGGPWL